MAGYGIGITLESSHEDALARTREALAGQGFGVLTEIDVAATMKAKLGHDMAPYVILGACNPPLAYQALTVEPSLGLLLPCNVCVRALDAGHTIVETIDPEVMVSATGNSGLHDVATEAKERLSRALAALSAPSTAPESNGVNT